MSTKKETLVLLDTHAIIHRAYHALPPLTSPSGAPVGAVYGLATMILKLVKDLEPDHIIAAYDLPGPTHRHEVYQDYKGTRPKLDPDLAVQIDESRKVLEAFKIPIYQAPGFEADDVIGTIAEKTKKHFNVIIASGDMDTLQLVDGQDVRVYTLRKGIQDTVLYDEQAVVDRYGFGPKHITDYKGIAGDTSDNIIGIPGIGEKGATELIKTFGSVEDIYAALKKNKNALVEKGFRERVQTLVREHQDEADFSKVLATIRIDAPISFVEPTKSFSAALDTEALVSFCTEFGFRSLVPRMRALTATTASKPVAAARSAPVHTVLSATDTTLLKQCAVMTWLLNSEVSNPSVDDVYAASKEKNLTDAAARLKSLLAKERLDQVYRDIEEPLIPVIDAMNQTGVAIDAEYLRKLSIEYHRELDQKADLIYRAAGEEFNINSPKQLGEILFTKLGLGTKHKKTATGQLSTKESELLKLQGEHPIVDEILAYRELAKLLGTYIDAIPPLLDTGGRLHTTFSQTGAATGRLSSRDPGLQNIPTKTELGRRIRRAFVAPPWRVLLACDYSQIELRLAAMLSGDEKLIDIFARGEDVHAAVAAQVFGVPEHEVTKDMRRSAKVINFGILYGMGVNALRENLGTDRKEAQAFYTKYFETFATLARYLEKTKETAARVGYTTTYFGRKRYFPGMKSPLPFIRASAERMAINAPLQGTQADIIKIAMARIHAVFEKKYAGRAALVLQIHDELIVECDEAVLSDVQREVKTIMEGVLTRAETSGVPILVSAEAGPNWADLQPI
ncbi:MAG: DNA polymerase [Candidatus Pacebacteria bacterium]|nr:DNA polymerase [Candidatus Paceibacterota bacterium]